MHGNLVLSGTGKVKTSHLWKFFFLIDDLETFATSNDLLQRTSEFPELFGLFDFFLFYLLNNDVFWHKFISSVINVIF